MSYDNNHPELTKESSRTAMIRILRLIQTIKGSKSFLIGSAIFVALLVIGYIGPFFIHFDPVALGTFAPSQPPSFKHPLGTDDLGRDVLALTIVSLKMSLSIGLLAGIISTLLAVVIGFISGYKGGLIDDILSSVTDIFLVIPLWPILVLVATYLRVITIPAMATLLAVFSWPWPTRTIRSQVLSLRERLFVDLARLSGLGDMEVIFREILPNMLAYIAAGFVSATSGAMMSEVGLELLGLGPQHTSSLGLMLYWITFYSATFRGMWWWVLPPIICLILIFSSLFLISIGIDEIANPRLRRS